MRVKKSCLKLYFKKVLGIMAKLRTVQGWGFSCLEYEVNDEGEVNKIICKICREFYSTEQEQKKLANKYKGSEKFLQQANAYINGSSVVKKVNFEKTSSK